MSKYIKLYFDEINGQYCLLNGQLVSERSDYIIYEFLSFVSEAELVLHPLADLFDAKAIFFEWLYDTQLAGSNERLCNHRHIVIGFVRIIRDLKKRPVGLNERYASVLFTVCKGHQAFGQLYQSLNQLRREGCNPNYLNQFYSDN